MEQIEQTISSLEVAEMVGKPHANLLRSIRTYEQHFNQLKIDLVEYFQQTSYLDGKGEERKSYNITKKGCEFIAHKMTGIKGTEFTVKYIDRFHDMEHALTESVQQKPQLTPEEIVDWKLNDLHKRVKELEGGKSDKFALIDLKLNDLHRRLKAIEERQVANFHEHGRLTPRENTWYEKNRNRIWRIRYDKNMELRELYHLILEECGKYYDMDEAEQIYRSKEGAAPTYGIDLVEYFPELQDIANQVLDYFEG